MELKHIRSGSICPFETVRADEYGVSRHSHSLARPREPCNEYEVVSGFATQRMKALVRRRSVLTRFLFYRDRPRRFKAEAGTIDCDGMIDVI